MVEDERPRVRASYVKLAVGTAKRQIPSRRDAILAALGDDLRQRIRTAGTLEWLPATAFLEFVATVARSVGANASREFWQANMLESLSGRLLTPLRVGATRLFGNNPGSLVRMTPQAWRLVTANCGVSSVDVSETGKAVLRFDGLPAMFRETSAMLDVWAGGCDACIERAGFRGASTPDSTGLRVGIATVTVTWV